MNENIKKVRRSIETRKRHRKRPGYTDRSHQLNSTWPQEEEKHGYLPLFPGAISKRSKKGKDAYVTGFIFKGILALMLFLGTALLMRAEMPVFSQSQQWTSAALSEEFPFARVNAWYQESFGAPLAFEPEKTSAGQEMAMPVGGQIVQTFQANGSGIMIAPEEVTNVTALKSGIVIFAGNDRNSDKTVLVQHADNSISTYGYLSSIDVHVYQSVGKNEQLGMFKPSDDQTNLYFAIEKDHTPVDPVQVIQVDERP